MALGVLFKMLHSWDKRLAQKNSPSTPFLLKPTPFNTSNLGYEDHDRCRSSNLDFSDPKERQLVTIDGVVDDEGAWTSEEEEERLHGWWRRKD